MFALLLTHGASLGLTDDEAYYWALAQEWRWGFAYHPPMILWMISAVEAARALVSDQVHELWVRLPAVFCAACSLAFGMLWMEAAGAHFSRLWKGGWVALSFAGFFALSWMSVPDLPLFLGWTMAFYATWKLCFGSSRFAYPLLAVGVGCAVLAKFSGVLAAGSAGLALLLWAPRRVWIRGWGAIIVGLLLAAIPILIWNLEHEWYSVLYQAKGRHQGAGLSWVRFGRFWAVQLLAAGPALVLFTFWLFARAERPLRYVAVWILPGLIFCVQPLFSDFKPHWAFVVWWPASLALGWAYANAHDLRVRRLARVQAVYGLSLSVLILLACHVPLQGWVSARLSGKEIDSRHDVTNDMYGWEKLPEFLESRLGTERARTLPVTGSRYQTASQAAFALGSKARVGLVPTEAPIHDEWPDLDALEPTSAVGPEWPKLRSPVIYVADNRYGLGPGFREASCTSLGRAETRRGGVPARWIEAWLCEPQSGEAITPK